MTMHKTQIIGYVGRDAEMRYTPSGQQVTSFSVAVDEQYKTQAGETVKNTVWFRVSAWGKTAENCSQYVKKGMLVYAEGRLEYDPATGGPKTWTAQDGTVKANFDLRAIDVRFLSRVQAQAKATAGDNLPPEDELPF